MITGGCFCGAVRYQIEGSLGEARSCHCSRCRKAFSAQSSAYADLGGASLTWIEGEALLTHYPTHEPFGLAFCSRCGSTLCGTVKREVHGVTLGCVDGDPGVVIQKHTFVGSKAPWERIPEGVEAYVEGPDGERA